MSYIGGFFRGAWTVIKVSTVLLTLLLLILLFYVIGTMSTGQKPPTIPGGGAALVIKFEGGIVERKDYPDLDSLLGDEPPTIVLRDLVRGIDAAAKDDRIEAVVLDLDNFNGALPATLHYVGGKLESLRESGKKVIAVADSYSQAGYLVASYADEIHMHPFGSIMPTGYGVYRTFYKDLLDKLKVTVNNFTVGEFKSAGEPFFRNDMSEPAKAANRAFLTVLWDGYLNAVNSSRGLTGGGLAAIIANVEQHVREAGGDAAQVAKETDLVDSLKSRNEQEAYLKDLVGADKEGKSYRKIGLHDYLKIVNGPAFVGRSGNKPKVGVVIADGPIVMGDEDDGVASADAVTKLLREARDDQSVKAVVFRVNSPGGSAFASEIIRREVQLLRDSGKPVVVSMGGVAASGGYWISMAADEVMASPTTITGSIGVVGIVPTFENTIELIGLNVDGVGTTDLADDGRFGLPLDENAKAVIQLLVEDIYDKFLNLVAEARGMTRDQVHEIAQGRVWAGTTAKELGLIDTLGTLDEAVASAATRANLTEYKVHFVEREATGLEKFLASMSESPSALGLDRVARPPAIVEQALGLADRMERDLMLNDPNQTYAVCGDCLVK
ncbi:MAG: signal peptide peptidase SppA [Alphaproteobacteria bacterium]